MAKWSNINDVDGFGLFFKKTAGNIHQFIARYVHDEAIAKDLMQDTFMKLYERRDQFENEIHSKAYAYTVAKNLSLDYLKHQKVKQGYFDSNPFAEEDNRNFLKDITYIESIAIIKNALNQLSPREKSIIELSMEEMSNEEIARELDISINTVKTLKKRAYEKLRQELSDSYSELLILTILILSFYSLSIAAA